MKDGVVDEQNLWQPEDIINMRARMFELIVDLHTKYEEYEEQKARVKSGKPAKDAGDDDLVAGEPKEEQRSKTPAPDPVVDRFPEVPMTPEHRQEEPSRADVPETGGDAGAVAMDSPQRGAEESNDTYQIQEVNDSQEVQEVITMRPEEVLPGNQEEIVSVEVSLINSSPLSEPPLDTPPQVSRTRSNLAEVWGMAEDIPTRQPSMEL